MNETNIDPLQSSTFRLTIEVNKKMFLKTGKSFEINTYTILKDDIKNYRRLNEYQLLQIEKLTEKQSIEIIKIYDTMIGTIENLLL